MERFFLAMMVSAVVLLIAATDLLVNGSALQEPAAKMANVSPAAAVRLTR
jgi:hypothetical protein